MTKESMQHFEARVLRATGIELTEMYQPPAERSDEFMGEMFIARRYPWMVVAWVTRECVACFEGDRDTPCTCALGYAKVYLPDLDRLRGLRHRTNRLEDQVKAAELGEEFARRAGREH
jgi:hypothetical protein